MPVSLADELIALLEPLAELHGQELVTVEVAGGRRAHIVRVFLDREGGIDIDAIADANAWIAEALESVARLSGPYTLEVSSPGLERVLRKSADFERFAGHRVQISLSQPLDGHTRLTGILISSDGDELVVNAEDSQHRVRISAIEKARLKPDHAEVGRKEQ